MTIKIESADARKRLPRNIRPVPLLLAAVLFAVLRTPMRFATMEKNQR